jgi:hypothetical protein
MGRDSSGTYTRTQSDYSFNTVISETQINSELNDIAAELTASLEASGKKAWTGNQNCGSQKMTALAVGSALTDSTNLGQVQNGGMQYATGSGTNTITATMAPAITAYVAGQTFRIKMAAGANTGATTLNLNSVGAKAITKRGTTALAAGDIPASMMFEVAYDGTQFQLINVGQDIDTGMSAIVSDSSPQLGGFLDANGNYIQMQKGGDIASASPTVIDTDGDYFICTGTTGFSAMTVAADRHFFLEFAGALVMTHGAGTLDIPGGANITTAAGDVGEFFSTASNVVTCVNYAKKSGKPIVTNFAGSDIAANAIDSDHYTDGSIDPEHLANNAVTLAKMASGTDGNIISYDASGDPVAIATGNDGQVLTSTGAGSPPAFETLPAGGATISASNPTITTNSTLGTQWANSSTGDFYILTDATTDENVWSNVGTGSSSISPSSHAQGSTSAYQSGGTSSSNIITKFAFASVGTFADVGDLTAGRYMPAGSSSSAHGYTAGGYSSTTVIDKFTFSSDANATSVGSLNSAAYITSGGESTTHGYTCGGVSSNVIQKHSFSTDGNSTDVGDLTVTRRTGGTASSSTHGVTLGGNVSATDNIDRFSFSSDGNSTDFGSLSSASGQAPVATNSMDYGYAAGGLASTNIIEKFAFATGGSVTDVGDLTVNRDSIGGSSSSTTHGYTCGGYNGSYLSSIDAHSFSTDGNATNVGDLASPRSGSTFAEAAGQQV